MPVSPQAGSLIESLARRAGATTVEENANAAGLPLFTIILDGCLRWLLAAPGTDLPGPGGCAGLLRWRLQDPCSLDKCPTDLSTVVELLPQIGDRAHELHRVAVADLLERRRAGEAGLDVDVERLESELRQAARPAVDAGARADCPGWWHEHAASAWKAVTVTLKPPLGMAAESGESLLAGEERRGRFRAVLSSRSPAATAAVEVEIDVKRSLVTLHPLDERTAIAVAGRSIGRKWSIPVSDREDGGDPASLRLGRQLSEELERVVSVG